MCLKTQECRSCFGRSGRGGAGVRGVGVDAIEGVADAKASEGAGVLF